MGLRSFIRARMADTQEHDDASPVKALVYSIVGKDEDTPHALGEYTAETYPTDVAEQLRRRGEVAAALRAMDLGSRDGRSQAVPRLKELLRTYPHPLAYEALVLAYVDQRWWDEARGVAFAARERRWEVEHSPFPEIRAEVDRLKTWTPEDVEELRREAIGELVTPGVPAASPSVAGPVPALG
jgi:hypothetical protein